jgi:phage anti-repressor protein/phage antirepressor YoqD-like protein
MNQVTVSFEIPVTEGRIGGQDALVVDGRALHVGLGSARKFTNWIDHKIERLGLIEGVDYDIPDIVGNKYVTTKRTPERIVNLSLEAAKHLAMSETTAQGKAIRAYFIECEKRYHASLRVPAPVPVAAPIETALAAVLSDDSGTLVMMRTMMDKLIEQNDKLRQKEEALQQAAVVIEEMKPAVDFTRDLLSSDITYGFQEASRLLGMPPNLLGSRLRDMGYLFRRSAGSRNKFYAEFGEAQKGFFMERLTREGFPETRVTPKGLAHFRTLFAQGQLALPAPTAQKALPSPMLEEMDDLFGFGGFLN